MSATATNGKHETKSRLPAVNQKEAIIITPLKQAVVLIPIVGETPLKILRFSKKNQDTIIATQQLGDQAKSKKKREPKDFSRNYEEAKYLCTQREGNKSVTWCGLNASGVRNGAIETCRMAGFAMTRAKMSIFCVADGFDDLDRTQLVRVHGEPEMSIDPVRNASGVIDLRARVMFPEWKMALRIRFDESQFSPADIVNLIVRVGQQNGLGEGRPNGTNGNGCDNGIFVVDFDGIKILSRTDKPPVFEA